MQHELDEKPMIPTYCHAEDATSKMIDEIVYSNLYDVYAYRILSGFILERTKQPPDESLLSLYHKYQQGHSFIEFEYENGTKNKFLNQEENNYMMLPVRGIIAILILLTGMIGTLFWYEDERNQLFLWLSPSMRPAVALLYLLLPCLMAGFAGIIAICLTGFANPLWQEIPAMLLYVIAITSFCAFLRSILPALEQFLAAIPVSLIGSMILCPVFIDLTGSLPWLRPLRPVTPVYHYLRALFSTSGKWNLFLYSILLFLLTAACRATTKQIQHIRRREGKNPC